MSKRHGEVSESTAKRYRQSGVHVPRNLIKPLPGMHGPRMHHSAYGPSFARSKGSKGETKAVDLIQQTLNLDNGTGTSNIIPINLILAGAGFNNRIGRKIAMKSVNITGSLQPQGNSTLEGYYRLVVVYDSQTNGALPAWSDVFKSVPTGGDGSADTSVWAGLNLNNRDRFKIIAEQRWSLPTYNPSTGANGSNIWPTMEEMTVNIYRKLGGLETQYSAEESAAPALITSIATGSLILLGYGNTTATSGGYAAILNIRLRYEDN